MAEDEQPDPANGSLLLAIKDVYTISSRGVAAFGTIERGIIRSIETVDIIGLNMDLKSVGTMGLEIGRKPVDEARAGDDVVVLLRAVRREAVRPGQVIASPGVEYAFARFEADIELLAEEAGGRATPVTKGYKPFIRVRTAEVTGEIELPEGTEKVNPGASASVRIAIEPRVALSEDLVFEIAERDEATAELRTVGRGVITKPLV
ncbi:EF-Tu/IF-2/RF-3 family GTPase [Streptomyces sp. NPDC059525]|uniref:EF-Tu C-terminal domain-related protein n=1 Tax=Streptomyces sp. NPDC059525 TaxID=3346857 RepID=UPI00368F2C2A